MAENGAMRTETFPVGIVGVGVHGEQRQVRADEPPPLPPNAELAVIGKPHPRLNGRAKVTGATRYTVDIAHRVCSSGVSCARPMRTRRCALLIPRPPSAIRGCARSFAQLAAASLFPIT